MDHNSVESQSSAASLAAAGPSSTASASSSSNPQTESSDAQRARPTTERTRGWKRRTAKACDACRKRKIRCDGLRPICSRCSLHGIECVYADFEKEGPVRRSRGPTYVQQLEQRLRHVETKLGNSGAAEPDEPLRGRHREKSASVSTVHTASAHSHSRQRSEDVVGQSAVLARGRTGDLRYFGPGSSLSMFSSPGLQWIASHTRDPSVHRSLRTTLDEDCRWTKWTHPVLQDTIRRESTWPLPPWSEALGLVEEYFQNFHKALPIFHPPTFMSLLSQQYSGNPIRTPGWWASLNAVLAIAQRRRCELDRDNTDQDAPWGFAKNALDVMLEILMLNTTFASVQALVALCVYFLGTSNPQPSFFLASAAVRTSHAIGLHETTNLNNISAFEREQRHQVFWCAVIVDQATSFRTGRPPAQALHGSKLALPESMLGDSLEITNREGDTDTVDMFYFNAWMARIQAEILYRLYSTVTVSRSEAEITVAVLELDEKLQQWREALPISVRPGHPIDAWCQPFSFEMARLHLEYHYSVITIHRMKAYRNGRPGPSSDSARRKSDPLQFVFSERCVEAAKKSIDVLGAIPHEAESFFWAGTHFPLSIFVILFINKLPHPIRDPDELKAAETLIEYTSRFSGENIESHGHLFLAIMKELLRAARITVSDEKEAEQRAEQQQYQPYQQQPQQPQQQQPQQQQSQQQMPPQPYPRDQHEINLAHHPPISTASVSTQEQYHASQQPLQQLTPNSLPGSGFQWNPAAAAGSSSMHDQSGQMAGLNAEALEHIRRMNLDNNPAPHDMGGMSATTMGYGAPSSCGGQTFEGQDAWEALAQMPFPFPWNWQDLPFDMMQDIEPYRS